MLSALIRNFEAKVCLNSWLTENYLLSLLLRNTTIKEDEEDEIFVIKIRHSQIRKWSAWVKIDTTLIRWYVCFTLSTLACCPSHCWRKGKLIKSNEKYRNEYFTTPSQGLKCSIFDHLIRKCASWVKMRIFIFLVYSSINSRI